MQIDIRTASEEEAVDELIFHGPDCHVSDAVKLVLNGQLSCIVSKDGRDNVYIDSTTHAKNLIKALQKAIELGTWDE